jgi:hypothetical protein
VRASQEEVRSAKVQMLHPDGPRTTLALGGSAHFDVRRPAAVTVTAFPPSELKERSADIRFAATSKSLQILPGCIHAVAIDLTPVGPGNLW